VTEVAIDGLVVVTWNVARSCPLGMVTVAYRLHDKFITLYPDRRFE
jgi:hypothetical protein